MRSTCLDNHVSEDFVSLSKYLARVSCESPDIISVSLLLYNSLRLHGYVGHVLCMTRGPEVATAPSSASDTIFSPFHPVHHVGALTALNNTCRSPDNSEDAVFGRLILGFPDETIDAILFDQPLDTESGFMDVPQLLAPNSHTRNTVWPIDMSSLITFNGFSAFYTVKGVKSLNLELTWRPFNSEQAMPTLEELAGISELNYFGENDIDVEDARAQVWAPGVVGPL